MAGWIKKVKAFQFKGILVILGCFLLIGAILFAERSGLSYREKAKKLTYLDARSEEHTSELQSQR